jgi:K+-sensing histidine kinase KdpD
VAVLSDLTQRKSLEAERRRAGIGLWICAGIAAAHRAKLRAANRPAGGAIFTLELPLADPDSART